MPPIQPENVEGCCQNLYVANMDSDCSLWSQSVMISTL